MKKFYFAGLAALAVIAFGCSRDNINDPNPDKGGRVEGYITLEINGTPVSKTAGTTTEPGTSVENAVNDITIVFTDAAGLIEAVATPTFNATVTPIEVPPFLMDVGSYYVYALINANGVPVNITVGQNINHVIDVLASEFANGYNNASFFMTNQHNASADQAGQAVTITSANAIGSPASVSVNVDRVAVRIDHVASTPDISALTADYPLIAGVQINGFATLNVNKQMNVIQQWGLDNENSTTHNPLTYEVLHTPVYGQATSAVPSSNLVADQYFNNISNYTFIDRATDGSITAVTDLTVGQSGIFGTGTVYVTENRPTMMFFGTPEQPTAGRGETTGVIYQVQATDGTNPLGTFYLYKGTIYADRNALQANTDFASTDLSTIPTANLRGMGIKVFENGIMYYTYFILDPNTSHQYNGDNYYGVFRNSIYRLTVNSLTDIGNDVPGGTTVDPTQPGEPGNPPIDTEEAYIEVEVTINPWILNTISIDF